MLKGQQYSRLDGTKICPECGILEGLDAAGWSQEEKEEAIRLAREGVKQINELNSLYGNGETTGVGNQIYQWKGEQNTVLQMTAFSKNDEKATVILCVASFEYSIGS